MNGSFVSKEDAKVSVFDTGFYYGDAIYEVVLLHDGAVVDLESHFARLKYVLKEVKFNNLPTSEELTKIIHELVERNKEVKNGMIYLQITRGLMENRYADLRSIAKPTVIAYIVPTEIEFDILKKTPLKCELIEDPRRYRRDIKMTSLMPMILAKINSKEQGYDYTIFKDRITKAVTEGISSNLFIVNESGMVLTHPTGKKILNGCTRKKIIEFLKAAKIEVKEQEFFEDDLLAAKEAFVTGSIKLIVPIESINGEKIGSGTAGEVASLCAQKYHDFALTFKKV